MTKSKTEPVTQSPPTVVVQTNHFSEPLRIEIRGASILNFGSGVTERGAVMDLWTLDWGPTGRAKTTQIVKNVMALKGVARPSRADLLRWLADVVEKADAEPRAAGRL